MTKSRDEELLSAYFDGELHGREAEALEDRLAHGDANLRAELRAVKVTRDAVCDWAREGAAMMAKNGPMWDAIEARLGHAARRPSAPRIMPEWLVRLKEFLATPEVLGVGAFACMALLVVAIWAPRNKTDQTDISLGRVAEAASPESLLARQQQEVPVSLASVVRDPSVSQNVVRFVGEESSLGMPIGEPLNTIVPEYAQDDQRAQRFREADLDVEWLKSDKPVSVMAARSRTEPPVIWVAQR